MRSKDFGTTAESFERFFNCGLAQYIEASSDGVRRHLPRPGRQDLEMS
jgi:hypothetical protein